MIRKTESTYKKEETLYLRDLVRKTVHKSNMGYKKSGL